MRGTISRVRGRARWKWVTALTVLPLGALAYQGLHEERLDPADLLPPSAERAASAEALLAAAPTEGGDPAQEAVRRGRELYETWKFAEARAALELALELDPEGESAAEAYYNLGLVELRQPGDFLRSVACFEKAIELEPEDGRFPLGLAGAVGAQVMTSGSLLAGAARIPRIKELLQQAVQLDPDSVDARNALFQFYLRVPGFLGGGGDQAAEQAAELERIDAVEGLVAKAQIEDGEKHHDEAEALFRRAVAEDPERGAAQRALGSFLAARERHAEALESFQAYARLDSGDPSSHDSLGEALRRLGQHEAAAAAFRRALEIHPDSVMARLHLAACLDESGDVAGAAQLYRAVVADAGEGPWADKARDWLDEHGE